MVGVGYPGCVSVMRLVLSTRFGLCQGHLNLNLNLKLKYPQASALLTSASGGYGNRILFPQNMIQKRMGTTTRINSHNLGNRMNCYHGNSSTSRQHDGIIMPDPECKERSKKRNDAEKSGQCENFMEQFIRDNSEVSRDHLTPEIALRLMTPACRLWSAPMQQSADILQHCGIGDPFWAFYWPGGQALTRYVLDYPSVVRGKDVLDVGSGCGASAIAAAMCGARSVLANDIDRVSIQAIKLNADLNGVTIATTSSNLIGCVDNQWDVVFLGDMFYDRDFTDSVADWLRYLADCGTEVLIGDPGRIFLQEHPIRELLVDILKVDLFEKCRQENNGMTEGFVWKLCKPPR